MNCCLCGKENSIGHHVFGGASRLISDKYRLVVPLCHYHHTGAGGFHQLKDGREIAKWERKFCKMLGLDYNKTLRAVISKHNREYLDKRWKILHGIWADWE